MTLKYPICRQDISVGRNIVCTCDHASMPFGVVFTTERNNYEWNCSSPTNIAKNGGSNISNYGSFREFKYLEKKSIYPIIFK